MKTLLTVCCCLALTGSLVLPQMVIAQPQATAASDTAAAATLKPANTSSPRDTLRSFIENMEANFRTLGGDDVDSALGSRRRALSTLDFSATGRGFDWIEQGRRSIFLKEILDRTPLPPWEDIPDENEVREQDITRWTIPDTRLVIARVEEGEREGEFLFSASTVADLHLTYRLVEDKPYLAGATAGFLDSAENYWRGESGSIYALQERLRPIDASTPRALFEEFLLNMNEAYRLVMEADAKEKSAEGLARTEAQFLDREAQAHIDQAIATLDLSDVSRARRHDVGMETVLQLKEVFDRARLPAIQSIPGVRGIAAMREGGGIPRWEFPGTSITIAEIQQGQDAGRFRFTSQTVDRAADIFATIEDLPYRQPPLEVEMRQVLEAQYADAGTSPGFFNYYESMPGTLVPSASWLWPVVERLPAGLSANYYGQTLWQWMGIVLAVAALIVGVFLIGGAGELIAHYFGSFTASWIKILMPLTNALLVFGIDGFIDRTLNVTGLVIAVINTVSSAAITLFLASAVLRLTVALAESVVALPRFEDREFDASLVRVAARMLGFFIAVVVAVQGFSQLGIEIMPLIAGLGVGGIAVALAVRPTLENMIGGLIIYADKPVKVGDFCTFGDQKGTVEGIGLRSTRIRGLDRTVITVPNSVFADMQIVNFARCDSLLISTVIGVRYETSMEQMRNLLAKMRQICFAHPRIETDTLRIRFGAFGPSSLDINVRVYALTNEWNEFHAIREDLFMRFADAIEEAGSSIAFPSTTVYMGEDEGLNEARKQAAEQEVAAWRDSDELPFPTTPERLAQKITDTGDYPPRGSPQAAGKRAAEKTEERLSDPGDQPPG